MINRTTRFALHAALGLSMTVGLAMMPGCETGPSAVGEEVSFSIQPSSEQIMAGETVTLTSESQNVLGRDAQIEWHPSGGELRTSQNGRVAQITFPNPGTYNVTADLIVGGQRYTTQTTRIEVQPLPVQQMGVQPQQGEVREGALQPGEAGGVEQQRQNQGQMRNQRN